jgi:hypothetical protein
VRPPLVCHQHGERQTTHIGPNTGFNTRTTFICTDVRSAAWLDVHPNLFGNMSRSRDTKRPTLAV